MKTQTVRLARIRVRAVWEHARDDSLDLVETAVRHWFPEGSGRDRIDAALARRRGARQRMKPLMDTFAEQRRDAFFIQVGANDNPARDPLRAAIHRCRWAGIVVEPIPSTLSRLRRSYEDLPGVTFEQAAITTQDEERPFFYLPYPPDPTRPQDLPGSLRHEALLFRRRFDGEQGDEVVEITTQGLTFESLCARHRIDAFDVLEIDTDGDEHLILEQVDLRRFAPLLIVFHSAGLAPGVKAACDRRLGTFGYEMIEHGSDTWCMKATALHGTEGEALAPIWRWTALSYDPERPLPATSLLRATARRVRGRARRNGKELSGLPALSDAEQRYLQTGYDDSVPLPGGAQSYLVADNPRLLELRRSYERLDVPAVEHHLWRPARVSGQLDLRYFRGDNVYQWHYPEHPRAMALALYIYMRYVRSRGGEELLGRLAEDGRFGAWTTEISGHGKISRDLLDSINEILFLDRQLSVLSRPGLRILDIGAGYGRLAHRMSAAIPGPADYCCVDAVPESTFLSEYYLAFRGCSPPARVVPLTHAESKLASGSFDLAVNVHSFSECTLAAIEWWAGQLRRLEVPHLFVVPNEPDGIVSRETDGSYYDALPALAAAGYRPIAKERVLPDPAVRELVRIYDNFYLFALSR